MTGMITKGKKREREWTVRWILYSILRDIPTLRSIYMNQSLAIGSILKQSLAIASILKQSQTIAIQIMQSQTIASILKQSQTIAIQIMQSFYYTIYF
jgi:hypothetical protein